MVTFSKLVWYSLRMARGCVSKINGGALFFVWFSSFKVLYLASRPLLLNTQLIAAHPFSICFLPEYVLCLANKFGQNVLRALAFFGALRQSSSIFTRISIHSQVCHSSRTTYILPQYVWPIGLSPASRSSLAFCGFCGFNFLAIIPQLTNRLGTQQWDFMLVAVDLVIHCEYTEFIKFVYVESIPPNICYH